MPIKMSKGFSPITNAPQGSLERWKLHGNTDEGSVILSAEGGTLKQSYHIGGLTEAPFNIEVLHLYESDIDFYLTNIKVYASPQSPLHSPLGEPRLRFYLLSPNTSNRYTTIETDTDGEEFLVYHLTLDEFENNQSAAIESLHGEGAGVNAMDNFLQSFRVICNIANEDSDGNLNYTDVYYNDPSDSTKRHRIDLLVYSELPINNINTIDVYTPIAVACSELRNV